LKTMTLHPDQLAFLDRLRPYLVPWPAVFPTADDPTIRPLALGISRAIDARLTAKDGESKSVARHRVKGWISRYTRSAGYLLALAQPGAMRHDVDGVPVEPVSDEHQAVAQAQWAECRKNQRPKRQGDRHSVPPDEPEPIEAPAPQTAPLPVGKGGRPILKLRMGV
jgi:sRNA-binding protein